MTTPPTNHARSERAELAALLAALGPDAPTLCEGWSARDLAAHVAIRERRPDAMGGILLSALADRTRRVQASYAAKPWHELVELVREGPPRWSPLTLDPLDRVANTVEFFVHHEDLRRAQAGWAPRPLEPRLEASLWRALTLQARLHYRRARVGVVLHRDGGGEIVARDAAPGVVVTGPAGELILHAHGRTSHARVEVTGDPEAVRLFATTPLDT